MVIQNQSLLDISIQEYGSVEHLISLAIDNDLSITDDLVPGTKLIISKTESLTPDVQRYYKNRFIRPATSISQIALNTLFEAGLFNPGLFD